VQLITLKLRHAWGVPNYLQNNDGWIQNESNSIAANTGLWKHGQSLVDDYGRLSRQLSQSPTIHRFARPLGRPAGSVSHRPLAKPRFPSREPGQWRGSAASALVRQAKPSAFVALGS